MRVYKQIGRLDERARRKLLEDLNRDRVMLRNVMDVNEAVRVLRRHLAAGKEVASECYYLTQRGNQIYECVSIGSERGGGGYWVSWRKYRRSLNPDEGAYLDKLREFATLDDAIEWMEGKTQLRFTDFHR